MHKRTIISVTWYKIDSRKFPNSDPKYMIGAEGLTSIPEQFISKLDRWQYECKLHSLGWKRERPKCAKI